MKKVIIDCDNTFGVPGRPIDDGQTILYLMGRDDIEIVGITTTHGNSCIEDVYPATQWLVKHSKQPNIPVYKGGSATTEGQTDASYFLAKTVAKHPKEITILAIGTMSNLYKASLLDPGFYDNCGAIACMGGYRYRLPVRGWNNIGEVNLSRDPKASLSVISATCPVTIFDAHVCFQAPWGLRELNPIYTFDSRQYYIMKDYLLTNMKELTEPVDYLWDLLPAVYISRPDLFHTNMVHLLSTEKDLETGTMVIGTAGGNMVNMPDYITDIDEFYNLLYTAWAKAPLVLNP